MLKQPEQLEEVYLSSGWYDLEYHQNTHFRWLYTTAELIVSSKTNKYLTIVFANHFTNKKITISTINTDGILNILFDKICQVGERCTVKIPLENINLIKFHSDSYYCPYERGDSDDKRKLSVMVFSFTFEDANVSYTKSINEIKSINDRSYATITDSKTIKTETNSFFTFENKKFDISKNVKHGILLYLPNLVGKNRKTLDNLNSFKHSIHDIPIVVYTDGEVNNVGEYPFKFIKIDNLPIMKDGLIPSHYKYATWAFIQGIKIAKSFEWDYFFCYEWDCMIGKDRWYDILWQEHLNWPYKPIMTGTPVFKCPLNGVGNLLQGVQDYRYYYSKQCHIYMNIEHVYPFSLYTNGALTFYDTKETAIFFDKEINYSENNVSDYMDTITSWDLEIGIRLFKKYGEKSFEKVGWLPSSYSGCGDYYYNHNQRLSMLESGLKVVIHQYKYL